jgi:uncharacterized protein HemX
VQPGSTETNPNIYNGQINPPVVNSTETPISTNNTNNNQAENEFVSTDDSSSSGGGGGTAIVAIIAVLVVLIPVGFAISYIVKKVRERREKQSQELMPLPDHSISNHT